MLEVLMVISVLNMGVAAAALVLSLRKPQPLAPVPTRPTEPEKKEEGKPFGLSDKRMQEGIDNILGYQVGPRGDDE